MPNNDSLHRVLTFDKTKRAAMQAEAEAAELAQAQPTPTPVASATPEPSLFESLKAAIQPKAQAQDISNLKNEGVVDPAQAKTKLRGLQGFNR